MPQRKMSIEEKLDFMLEESRLARLGIEQIVNRQGVVLESVKDLILAIEGMASQLESIGLLVPRGVCERCGKDHGEVCRNSLA